MLLVLLLNVSHLRFCDDSSASRTLFILRHFVYVFASKLIFFDFPLHKPVAVQTLKVIPVKALVNADQICPVGELLLSFIHFLVFLHVIFKAHCASTPQCVVVLREYLPYFFVHIVNDTNIILIFLSLSWKVYQSNDIISYNSLLLLLEGFVNVVDLVVIQAFNQFKLKLRRFKWVL